MCGIIGYIGKSDAPEVLLSGLERLEYRGYDSAGLAVLNGHLDVRKSLGRIENLAREVAALPVHGNLGISHTRWATHGEVTLHNAHPHTDQSGLLSLVHNGVIENFRPLRDELRAAGHTFVSETDSEVLAHLIGAAFDEAGGRDRAALVEAVRCALSKVTGTYGIAVIHAQVPELLVGARCGSPLVLGIGHGEHLLASDAGAIADRAQDVVYLEDGNIAALERDRFEISTMAGTVGSFHIRPVDFTADAADKGHYPHFMLKEIHEQPDSLREALRGRILESEGTAKLDDLGLGAAELRTVGRIVFTGCGTAFHAGLTGEYLLEARAQIPAECEYAGEFRYRNLPFDKDTLLFAISQSGETADTLAAVRESRRKGLRTLCITNNACSSIARECDGSLAMRAGPEIGVAATKSFTSQVAILALLSLALGRLRNLSRPNGIEMIAALESLPGLVERTLERDRSVAALAHKYAEAEGFLFMGRQACYPVALEAALKLKEISYLQASGHPSAELKHGVIALVSPSIPSVFIAPQDAVYEKNISNIEEVKARRGPVIAIGTEGDDGLHKVCDDVILIPDAPDFLMPILAAIPLQLLAYHTAVHLGCDVDKPRNLAKSVTVE